MSFGLELIIKIAIVAAIAPAMALALTIIEIKVMKFALKSQGQNHWFISSTNI